ncbi:MAG: type II toxin-antitoxin system prevent-host-death family antitoxin [Lapillicoccus sp.]
MPIVVNVHEAKSTLSRLLERVEAGERVVIARAGKPIADLVPHPRADILFGTGAATITYDPDTFDEHDDEITRLFDAD